MGTRGAYGFRINGEDKITYNQSDSYPSGLGNKIANFLSEFEDIEQLKIIAENIELVNEDDKPTKEQKEEAKKFGLYNEDVSSRSDDDWYCLIRNAQGDLSVYERGLKFMIDFHGFLADSLFCEWAYIINLDTGRLEIYKGFNKDSKAYGRYALLKDKANVEYFGVALCKWIPLENFFEKDIDLIYIEEEVDAAYEEAETD